MSRKLKPPKNLRWKTPRTCAFCRWFHNEDNGACICLRDPERVPWDTGDAFYRQQVCDRFEKAKEAS